MSSDIGKPFALVATGIAPKNMQTWGEVMAL